MNMTDDIRETIFDALNSAIYDVDTLSYVVDCDSEIASLKAALAWLEAQPETPEKHWQPLASGEVIQLDGDVLAEIGKWGMVLFRNVETDEQMEVSFPPRYRICMEATK